MKKLLLMIVCVMLAIAPLAGCEYEYDPGVEANLELVYTLVGEGEEAYYIVGKVKTLEEAELNSVSVNALTYEEKAAKLGVYGGTLEKVEVPAEHEGKPVKGVGAYAFYLCDAKEIVLPETVEFIGEEAFRNCTSLVKVTVGSAEKGSALKELGRATFRGCSELKTVYLYGDNPPAVKTFDSQNNSNPFTATNYPAVIVKNESYEVYRSNSAWSVYSDYLASESGVYVNGQIVENGRLVKYAGTESVVDVLEAVTVIGQYAFKNTPVTQVNFPAGLKEIGRQSFYGCKKLVTFTFQENSQLYVIGNSAFEACTSLNTAVIPSLVRIVNDRAFAGCTGLDTLFIESLVIEFFYTDVFEGCDVLENVYFVGSEEQFADFEIRQGNEKLLEANFIWNYQEEQNQDSAE